MFFKWTVSNGHCLIRQFGLHHCPVKLSFQFYKHLSVTEDGTCCQNVSKSVSLVKNIDLLVKWPGKKTVLYNHHLQCTIVFHFSICWWFSITFSSIFTFSAAYYAIIAVPLLNHFKWYRIRRNFTFYSSDTCLCGVWGWSMLTFRVLCFSLYNSLKRLRGGVRHKTFSFRPELVKPKVVLVCRQFFR